MNKSPLITVNIVLGFTAAVYRLFKFVELSADVVIINFFLEIHPGLMYVHKN